ncbi:HTH-type transcriptional regulator GbpR [Pigmentiphaga humi]|uniref:HTH-type transcriptional regulator GbpR n=1 Tax=Pigmentiphaga humi TaxID=2478468 RepID=A0A3P4B1T1_9BURK|nr:LysR substrate-binding domain-containing protein [Pigmentiphaga humi]VCU69526.1 HTH-type transcriptional regulator GbpR [Pigmentiphaga humi]
MEIERSIERVLTTQVKLRHLLMLKTVAECGTVSRAAEQLHMSQPAVSKTIHELESLLGERLLERTARGVVPTVFGGYVLRYARSLHAEIKRAAEELTALRQGAGGRLTVGSYMVALPSLVPRALSLFLAGGDGPRVSVVDGSKEKLLSGLQAGEIDIVVGRMAEQEHPDTYRQIPLYFEPMVLVAGRQNPLAAQAALTPADLAVQEWVMPHASSVARAPIHMFFAREGLDLPRRIVETLSFPLIRALLLQRDMVAALPWQIVQADIELGILARLPIDIGYPALPVGIILNTGSTLSAAGQRMVDSLRLAASELFHSPQAR